MDDRSGWSYDDSIHYSNHDSNIEAASLVGTDALKTTLLQSSLRDVLYRTLQQAPETNNASEDFGITSSSISSAPLSAPSQGQTNTRMLLTVLYLTVLGLCFIIPIFYYIKLHCEERRSRMLREIEFQRITAAIQESSLNQGANSSLQQENRAARRKYREERRARIIQLFTPVRMILREEHFPHLSKSSTIKEPMVVPEAVMDYDDDDEDEAAASGNTNTDANIIPKIQIGSLVSETKEEEESNSNSHDLEAGKPDATSRQLQENEPVATNIDTDDDDDENQTMTKTTTTETSMPSSLSDTVAAAAAASSVTFPLVPTSSSANKSAKKPPPEPERYVELPMPGLSIGKARSLSKRLVPTTCSICLCDYEVGSDIVWSSNSACDHVFHTECIEQWLTKQREGPLCPCCRRDFIIDPYDLEEEEMEEGILSLSSFPEATIMVEQPQQQQQQSTVPSSSRTFRQFPRPTTMAATTTAVGSAQPISLNVISEVDDDDNDDDNDDDDVSSDDDMYFEAETGDMVYDDDGDDDDDDDNDDDDDDDDDDVSGDGTNSNNDVENGDFVDTVAPVDVTMVDPNDDEDNDGGDDDNNDIEIDVEQGEVVVEEASDNGSNEFAVVDAEDETQDASVSCEEETKEEDHV
eukprot:CAMPEP_0119547676 /NCGR_PEP_ID=MMETSP1352-20130426/1739_1 /TAXON_ID=265584 /ORGANISM="Stauroneis constricta, Strain CCMP1120" /LENGTH=636 /DNA_ID=CAMNT_0007592663 /DNA_START=355 /DNA_END=2265 /DNA_ORIENTATION=+